MTDIMFDIFSEDLRGPQMPLFWTPKWLARRWAVSPETISRQCDRGDLEAKRIGGQWRIHRRIIESKEAGGSVDIARVRKIQKVFRKQQRLAADVPDLIGEI